MISDDALATGIATIVLAITFPVLGRMRPFQRLMNDQSWILSLGAGVSIAYVFVHMMPELAEARDNYAKSTMLPVMFRGILVYFVAMMGFMTYYGLENLRKRVRHRTEDHQEKFVDYRIHLGGFIVYVWMITYLLVTRLEKTPLFIFLYTLAMVAHFLTIDHSLREDHKVRYEHSGRRILALMCVLGWLTGLILPMPLYIQSLMLAFVSGAIIMNSAIMELPSKKEERFLGFLAGGVIYGLLLMPLG